MNRKCFIVILILTAALTICATAKENNPPAKAPETHIPAQIIPAMDKCFSAKQCNNMHNISMVNEWYFPAQQEKTYVVFAMKFLRVEPAAPKENESKQKSVQPSAPLTYHLYLRIYSKSAAAGKIPQEFNSPIPDQDNPNDVYSFAFPAAPDKYTLILSIASNDFTQVSTFAYDTELPSFGAADKLVLSKALFLKEIKKMEQVDTVFAVWKNCFHYALGEMIPYFENKFQATDQPNLLMQIFGASIDKDSQALKIEYTITIKKDKKEIIKFKPINIARPAVYQPVSFARDGKNLEKGDYELSIAVKDTVSDKKVESTIKFSIN